MTIQVKSTDFLVKNGLVVNTTATVLSTINATTSSNSGALRVAGGASVKKDLWVGGSLYVSGAAVITTATIASFAETTITAGTDTAVSANIGPVTIWNTSNLQSVTDRGATTNNIIRITTATNAGSYTSGALIVSGGVGIAKDLYVNGAIYSAGLAVITTASIGGSGVGSITAGTDTAVSASTGAVTIWDTSTLESVTTRGNTTTKPLQIFNTASNTVTNTSNALYVEGGTWLDGNLYVGGIVNFQTTATITQVVGSTATFFGDVNGFGALYAGVSNFTPLPSTVFQTTANINDYAQNNFQNTNNGPSASTDWVATSGDGANFANFIDMGMTSGTWDGSQAGSINNLVGPNDGYLYVQGGTTPGQGNLVIGASSTGSVVKIFSGGITPASQVVVINPPNTNSVSTQTGSLVVDGGLGLAGNITANNSLTLTGSTNGTGLYVTSSTTVYYSLQFGGSSDYLYNSTANVLDVGTNDFTIEFWMYPTRSATETIIASYSTPGLDITLRSGTWTFNTKSGTEYTGGTYSTNVWTHVAVTRNAGEVQTFTNGVLDNTYTVTDNYSSAGFIIGAFNTTPTQAFEGYLSDIRVIKNVAVYTATFTPTTSPLAASASTSLLTANQGNIADSSINNVSINRSGNPTVVTQTPYSPHNNSGISWTYDGNNAWQTRGDVKIGGGLTIDGNLVLVDQPTIYDQAGVAVDTATITLDIFDATVYRSAKYTVSISNKSTNQYQTSEIWLVQDGTNSYLEETSVFSNGGSLVAFTTTVSGNNVLLRAGGYNDGNIIKVQRTYITV
jgi:hypothetical protein